ncbi:hypothetical protein G9A89_008705 [Geosiphon pyriformis]|nr:hypothetical protein G9A89_008705 [Geosiphon pyriformis]
MKYKRGRTEGFRKKIDEVAIKIIITNISEVFKELNIRRAVFIKSGNLEYISPILGITQNSETLDYGIVMEFTKHGDIRKYLSTNFHSTSCKDKLYITWSIASGLEEIHSSDMVHHDLHPCNILLLRNNYLKIGDLGLCQPVNKETNSNNEAIITETATEKKKIYGVIPYIPPEVLRGEKFTEKVEIYSFSMLLWELVTGKPPFHNRSNDHIPIMATLNVQRPKITSPLIPPCYAELIKKCWDVNPKNRPTAVEVWDKLRELRSSCRSEFMESDKYLEEQHHNKLLDNKQQQFIQEQFITGLLTAQMVDFSRVIFSNLVLINSLI